MLFWLTHSLAFCFGVLVMAALAVGARGSRERGE